MSRDDRAPTGSDLPALSAPAERSAAGDPSPDGAGVSRMFLSRHPLVLHKLRYLRDIATPPKLFRDVVREITSLLLYEATADLTTCPLEVRTPMGIGQAHELDQRIGLVPILRAGLGMVEGALDLMPTAEVWHIGLYRDERTLQPVTYYNKLPEAKAVQVSLILDPMLATGGSAVATVDLLKHWGAARIKYVGLIAAPEGIARLAAAHPEVDIHVAAIDERLNDIGYIVPGLGDAGDRQFGTA